MLSPQQFRETQITAMCWGLAHAYRALFNTIQYPQGEEKVSGSDDKMAGTVATKTPATGTAVTPTPATGTAVEPKNQPVPVSVAPIHKEKYWKQNSAHLVRDEGASSKREQKEEVDEADYSEAGPSQEQQEEERQLLIREEEEEEFLNKVVNT